MAVDTRQIVQALGGRKALRATVRDSRGLARGVEAGLPFAALEAVMARYQLSRPEMARILRLPLRTLARRKDEGRLRPNESDRLVRLARVAAEASRVLESDQRAAHWLRSPILALGKVPPLSLLDTDPGVRQVEDLLGRIEHGVFS